MNKSEIEAIRKNYLQNRDCTVEDFKSALKEVQRDSPSVGGIIAGMDFQQFRAMSVFHIILEQEEYAESKNPYTIPEEEKALLADFVREAKEVFGDDYDKWYNHCKESS